MNKILCFLALGSMFISVAWADFYSVRKTDSKADKLESKLETTQDSTQSKPAISRYEIHHRKHLSLLEKLDIPPEMALNLESSGEFLDNFDAKIERFLSNFDAGSALIPHLRKMMKDSGVPQEFLFLAMAESEFKIQAKSPKKASGIWQLMPKTAKELGLVINDFIDERKDPIKSTQAAIKYLKFLRESYGAWYLAAMAYNCGPGRLAKAIEAAGSTDLAVLLDEEAKYLPQETRNYIRTIVQFALLFNNIDLLKNRNAEHMLNRGASNSLAGVKIKAGTHLGHIAKSVGMSMEELAYLNRHITHNFLPPGYGKYNVYIPRERLAAFHQNFESNYNPNEMFVLHKVKKGDTLTSIARLYKSSIRELVFINNLKKANRLSINQPILVPVLKKSV